MGGLFLECDVIFFNTSIFSTFCFIIKSLVLFLEQFGFISKNNLAIIFWCHFDAKKDTINTLRKQKNILLKFIM